MSEENGDVADNPTITNTSKDNGGVAMDTQTDNPTNNELKWLDLLDISRTPGLAKIQEVLHAAQDSFDRYDLAVLKAKEFVEEIQRELLTLQDTLTGTRSDVHQFTAKAKDVICRLDNVIDPEQLKDMEKINVGGEVINVTESERAMLDKQSQFQFLKMTTIDKDSGGIPFLDFDPSIFKSILKNIDPPASTSQKSKKPRITPPSPPSDEDKLSTSEAMLNNLFKHQSTPYQYSHPCTLRNARLLDKNLHAHINDLLPERVQHSYPTLIASSDHTDGYKDFSTYGKGEKDTLLVVNSEIGSFVVYNDSGVLEMKEGIHEKVAIRTHHYSDNSFLSFAPPHGQLFNELGHSVYDVYKLSETKKKRAIGEPYSFPVGNADMVTVLRLGIKFFSFFIDLGSGSQRARVTFQPLEDQCPYVCKSVDYKDCTGSEFATVHSWAMFSLAPPTTEDFQRHEDSRKFALDFLLDGVDVLPSNGEYDEFISAQGLTNTQIHLKKGKGTPREHLMAAFTNTQKFVETGATKMGIILSNVMAQELGFGHLPKSHPITIKVGESSFTTRIDTLLVFHRSILTSALSHIMDGELSTLSKKDVEDRTVGADDIIAEEPNKTPQALWLEVQSNSDYSSSLDNLSSGGRTLLESCHDKLFTQQILSSQQITGDTISRVLMAEAVKKSNFDVKIFTDTETIIELIRKLRSKSLNFTIDLSSFEIVPDAFNKVLNHMRLIRFHKCGLCGRPCELAMDADVHKVLRTLVINVHLF